MKKILLIFFLFFIFGCSKRNYRTAPPMDENTFVDLYVEVALAKESGLTGKAIEKIFVRYNFTPEKFHTMITYYHNNPRRWMVLYDKIVQKLTTMKHRSLGSQNKGKPTKKSILMP